MARYYTALLGAALPCDLIRPTVFEGIKSRARNLSRPVFPHVNSFPRIAQLGRENRILLDARTCTVQRIIPQFFPASSAARVGARIPETINESLLMNKIVGRVADRSACNRKENRIKRALNGAIIRGNGGEGARRNAQSGLCGVVMAVARNTGMRRDTRRCFGARWRRGRGAAEITTVGSSLTLHLSLSRPLGGRDGAHRCARARARKNAAGLRNSI